MKYLFDVTKISIMRILMDYIKQKCSFTEKSPSIPLLLNIGSLAQVISNGIL